mgnify:CR=1 FL=1
MEPEQSHLRYGIKRSSKSDVKIYWDPKQYAPVVSVFPHGLIVVRFKKLEKQEG